MAIVDLWKNLEIPKKLMLFASAAIAAAALVTAVLCLSLTRRDLVQQAQGLQEGKIRAFQSLLRAKGQEMRVEDGKLLVGDHVLNDNHEIVDELTEMLGGTATIFMGNTRVSTNVKRDDGTRAVGTKLEGPAYDALFQRGEPYRGRADILGVPYFTAYDPLRDPQGKVIGALYVGVKESDFLSAFRRAQLLVIGAVILLLAFCNTCTYFVVRRLLQPLRQATEAASRLAGGDLTVQFEAAGGDEVGRLVDAMQRMVGEYRGLLGRVVESSHELSAAAQQLSATTHEMVTSNERAASQSGAVAAGAEEMSVTVSGVAENSHAVEEASGEALRAAEAGALVISESVTSMQEIAGSVASVGNTVRDLGARTEKVGEVVTLIDDIADQTNLLALNAAIEAARAGSHGRGFAVVADEVRKLAEKTMKATQEIGRTLAAVQSESQNAVSAMARGQEKVEKGAELAEKAGEAMASIRARATRASDETRQIAVAAEQLAATIRGMAQNMEAISNTVETNTAAVAGVAQTATDLAGKADELRSLTNRFRL